MISRRIFNQALGFGAGAAAAGLNTPKAAAEPRDTLGLHTFTHPKQVNAGLLNIGYAELGPARGPVVVLLHGWPYGIKSYTRTASLLAGQGYRVIVPYLRGYGTTRFLSPETVRNAQQAAVALDVIALLDALDIGRAALAGFDWGARCACIVAALWPERCRALVSAGGYAVNNREANLQPLAPQDEHAWWYQFYFATERGRLAMQDPHRRRDFNRLIWQQVSPTWDFDEATFDDAAVAFDNPDYAAIVIHNYRWRLSLGEGETRYDALEAQLAARPMITVPSMSLDAEQDPFTQPGDGASYRDRFAGPYEHRTLKGVGHHVPLEAPQAFADAVMTASSL